MKILYFPNNFPTMLNCISTNYAQKNHTIIIFLDNKIDETSFQGSTIQYFNLSIQCSNFSPLCYTRRQILNTFQPIFDVILTLLQIFTKKRWTIILYPARLIRQPIPFVLTRFRNILKNMRYKNAIKFFIILNSLWSTATKREIW